MRTSSIGNLSLALALGLGVLGMGCKSSDPATAVVPAAGGTTNGSTTPVTPVPDTPVTPSNPGTVDASVPAPAIQYSFYVAKSEEDLMADSDYGYMIVKATPDFREAKFETAGIQVVGKFTLKGFNYYRLFKESGVLVALDGLNKTAGVIYAEPDTLLHGDAAIVYDNPDPRVQSEQYSAYITHLKDAWTTYGFGPYRPVSVGVDTGINFSHEDLTGQVLHAYSWYDLDAGGTALPAFSDPIDYVGTARTTTDGNGHGTHTGGTMAAVGNNGKGVAGVCWNTDVISYKGLADSGSGQTWAIYGSLYHLINWKTANHYTHTIPVNMSLGGSGASQFAIDMIEAALENNIVVIASMGNTGQNLAQYPSGYSGVIAVGASNGEDKKVHFSNSGRNISVCAPGYNIISTYAFGNDIYYSESGTSQAAPFVTGLVTYMLTFAPDLTPGQIKTYLETNADLIEGATGYTMTTGWGRVNVLKTIAAVKADVDAGTTNIPNNYVEGRLKVTVSNTFEGVTTPFSGVPVYLYKCDATGAITNYVASSVTVSGSIINEDGVAFFNLLKPGYYVAKATYSGQVGTTAVFPLAVGQPIPAQTIAYSSPTYKIQTFMDAGSKGTEDDVIKVWDATGTLIASYDWDALDTLDVLLATGKTYTIGVLPYKPQYIGEYALYVSRSTYPGTNPAPGTFAAPDSTALLGSQSHTLATPQAIALDQLYNCNLPTGGDFYTVTIP